MEPIDPADLRISDVDRNKVAEVLRVAAGDGRIDFEELDQRLEATYAAKTYRELVPITLDLPGHGTPAVPSVPVAPRPATPGRWTPVGAEPTYDSSFAVMSECRRNGVWDIGETHTATAFVGTVVVDLRRARFATREIVVNANAVWGTVEVIVDAHTVVNVQGNGIMGTFAEGRARVDPELDADSPVVTIRGIALMGTVEVKRRSAPGEAGRTERRHLGH